MLLLHAVNPYGFSHIRRVTEDNVDLNRNFQGFSKPLPENRGYAAIHDLLVPPDWDGPGRARAEAALDAWRDANGGLKAYQAAVAGGQYAFPDGLFFGGRRPTWSNATFRRILGTHGRAAKRVAVIDVHTGLGPTGYGEPISVHALDSPAFARARAWWGDDVTSTTAGTSNSSPITGSLIGCIAESLPGAEAAAIGLEFGTVQLAEVFDAIRGDNWLYARGLPSGTRHGFAPRPRHQDENPRRAHGRHGRLEGKGFGPRRRLCRERLSRSRRLRRILSALIRAALPVDLEVARDALKRATSAVGLAGRPFDERRGEPGLRRQSGLESWDGQSTKDGVDLGGRHCRFPVEPPGQNRDQRSHHELD